MRHSKWEKASNLSPKFLDKRFGIFFIEFMKSKLWPLVILLASVLALNLQVEGSTSTSKSSFVCRSNIMRSLYNVHKATKSLERFLLDSTATNRTKRSTVFAKPETCNVPFSTLQSMHREIDASLKASEAQSGSLHCSTQNSNNTNCKSVLKLIRCGVGHLRVAYLTSDSVNTPETQAKWENVISVMAANYKEIIANLKEELDQKRLRELDTLNLKLQNVKTTLACMEQFVRHQTRDSVADKILLGEFEIANSLIKDLGTNGTGITTIISQAYNKKPDASSTSSSKKVENAEKILDFLDQFDGKPRMGVHRMHLLLQEMKTSGHWPNAFSKFKRLLRKFKESSNCLPSDAQIRLYSLQHDLDKALPKYIGSVVDLIHAHNPSGALNSYKTNISPLHEPESLKLIITDAYNRPRNGSKAANADTIMEFIEKLRDTAEVEDGLNFLYGEMILNNDISDLSVLRLKHHYLARCLSNPDLKLKLDVGVDKAFSILSTYIRNENECKKLKTIAEKYPDVFDAQEVISRGFLNGPSSRAMQVAACIDNFASLLHKATGYEPLLSKMDDLSLIDTFEYMEVVFRYKKHSGDAMKTHIYPLDRFNKTVANLPSNIRNFFWGGERCKIVSHIHNRCLRVGGKTLPFLEGGSSYFTQMDKYAMDSRCSMTLIKLPGVAEWAIKSSITNTFLMAANGDRSQCWASDGCRRTFFHDVPNQQRKQGEFKIKPYDRAVKFAIMYTGSPSVLWSQDEDQMFHDPKADINERIGAPRDFWTFKCE